ncbi:18.1 kDa class I heat shock protein-like [Arachis stenosperma]|uniref:18.1 kDa class I heat shock protein-like n=1 Tax=Arachis stenosperma TaxID=217475 RepID=UPI0025AD3D60|nr:18.1 kDa class I heat shock protein-like [Arachis stenosperma]
MSSSFFGRRHEPPPPPLHSPHQTWEPNYHQDYGYGGYGTTITGGPSHMAMTGFPRQPSPVVNTQIEKKETPEAYVFKAQLPGLRRTDVRVEVDDDRVLCIVCERSVEKQEQRGGWHVVEMSSGHFVQRVMLPQNANVDHVKAYMDKGVLTVTVPKHHRTVNNHVRNVNISGH